VSRAKPDPKDKTSPALVRKSPTMADRIAELEVENATLKEMLSGEQSARVALEGVLGDQLGEILKLLRGRA
jgi:hypothetical protein